MTDDRTPEEIERIKAIMARPVNIEKTAFHYMSKSSKCNAAKSRIR